MTPRMTTRKFVYLSGAIDRAPDLGRGWRAQVARELRSAGAQPYDPALEQEQVCGLGVEALRALRETDLDRFTEKTRLVIANDLHIVAQEALAVVAYVSDHARMGTFAEMGVAVYHGVPLFVILDHADYQASGWTISSATAIFANVDAFLSWLEGERRIGKTIEQILRAAEPE